MNYYRNGWDCAFTKPGLYEKCFCKICETEMTVIRNQNGPTGMAESMAGGKYLHDAFYCPHAGQDWHIEAGDLLDEMLKTKSKRVVKLIRLDLDELLDRQDIKLGGKEDKLMEKKTG